MMSIPKNIKNVQSPIIGDLGFDDKTGEILFYDGSNWSKLRLFDFTFFSKSISLGRPLTLSELDSISEIEKNLNCYNNVQPNLGKDLIEKIEPIILSKLRQKKLKKILKNEL